MAGRSSVRSDDYARDAAGNRELPSLLTLQRYFGGWVQAIRAAGWSGPTAARQAADRYRGRSRRRGEAESDRPPAPSPVFVCGARRQLKLGDFGITIHGPKKGVPAKTLNPGFVDTNIYFETQTRWTVGDDLWQVGQLLAVALTGEIRPIAT